MTKPLVYIVIYSLYHHVYKLSFSLKEGLESKGVEVQLFQVQETLSDEILSKMQAPAKPDLPIISVDKLAEPDGILFGLPTRFGTMPAQMKALLDASGALWAKGALAGKFAGTFFSTASQHGGQETTALTAVTYFAHHGMMYVPFGYANAALGSVSEDEVIGGSAYGCGTISDGDGSRQPSHTELAIAENQGANFAEILNVFVKGRDSLTADQPYNTDQQHSNDNTDPQLSSAVNTNHGISSDTNHMGSNGATGAGVAAAGTAAAGAAAAATAASSTTGKNSTTSDSAFHEKTDNSEITSLGDGGNSLNTAKTVTSKNNIAPSPGVAATNHDNDAQYDHKATGDTSLNSSTAHTSGTTPATADALHNSAGTATDTNGKTPATTGTATGTTDTTGNTSTAAGTTPENQATGTTTGTTPSNANNVTDTKVTDPNSTGNTNTGTNPTSTTDTSKVGDTTNTSGTGATPTGVTGATGAAGAATTVAAGATAAGASAGTAAATGAAKSGTNAATNAATTAAGKSTATNPVKESLVKDKVKEKPKKKKWFCC